VHGAELLRDPCEAGARRSVGVTAVQAILRGGVTRAWLLRFGGALAWGNKGVKGRGLRLKGLWGSRRAGR
jgi:hypothetical protein